MIGRRSLLIFSANAIGGILGYVGLIAIVRFTTRPEEILGIVGFGLGFVGSFFVLTDLGIRAAHIKRVSQGEPLDQSLGAFVLLKILQISLATGVALLSLFVWTEVLNLGFETPLHLRVIFVMLVYFLAASAADLGITTFNARQETAKSQTSYLIGITTRMVGMVVVAVAGLGALALAWAYVLGAVAVAALAALLLRHYPVARPSRPLLGSYLKFAVPLSIPTALVALSVNIDKAVIQFFWGAVEVGYYFTIQRFILLLLVVNSAVSLLLFPSLSRYHARNELDMVRTKSAQSERYLSMILAPPVAFLVAYPEGVIHVLLSNVFLPATNVLRLFAIAAFVLALAVPRQAILQGMERSDLAGLVALAGALVTLALYFVLIPTSVLGVPLAGLGAEGAAAGVLAGYLVLLTLALGFTHRLVGDRLRRNVAFHLLAAAVVALLFTQLFPPASGLGWQWFHVLGFGAGFLGAYLALLIVIGEFRKPDLYLFLDILDPRKMARYVSNELRNDEVK